MQVDVETLKNECIPGFRILLNNIKTLRSDIKSVPVPSACSWVGDRLNSIFNNVSNTEVNIENISEWIKEKVIEYERLEKENINLSESLTLKLKERGVDIESMSIEEFFEFFSNQSDKIKNDYGIDQGILENYYYYSGDQFITWQGYDRLELLVMDKYDMSSKDAALLLTTMNTIGICTYASTVNNIIAEFRNNPKEFEEVFGFPMIRENEKGEIILNSEELLIDLYVYANSKDTHESETGAKTFSIDSLYDITESGMIVDKDMVEFNDNGRDKVKAQQYVSDDLITNEYIKTKNSKYRYTQIETTVGEWEAFVDYYDEMEQEEKEEYIAEKVQMLRELEAQGYQFEVDIVGGGEPGMTTDFTLVDTDYTYKLSDSAHRMKITEIADEGVYCSTWGKKAFLTYDEVLSKYGNTILATKVEKTEDVN